MKTVRALRLASLAAVCLFAAACAPTTPLVKDPPGEYAVTFISSKVRRAPGTVAWSPDGQYIAYLTTRGDQVMLYDPASGEKRPLEIKDPFFLSWANDLTLLVVHGDRENSFLTLLDISSKKPIRYPLPLNTVAVFGEPGAKHAWAFTERYEMLSIGMDTGYGLFRPDWKKNAIGEIANITRIVPIKPAGVPFLRGWAGAGPDPVSGKAILLQLISPPRAALYLKVLAIDTVTLEETEVTRLDANSVTKLASWSPDGSRLALTGNDGRLQVLSMDGTLTTVDAEVIGRYPTWDPRGGQIFFGGFLIADDGSSRARLVRGKARTTSAAFFSPGGKSMALSVKGKLWLIKGIMPSPRALKAPIADIRQKAATLRKLYRDDLITQEEYRERLELLLQQFEDDL